jgi:hypothetical protein
MILPFLARPRIEYDGTRDGRVRTVILDVCRCGDRRGPEGGVCGNCGNAIPNGNERRR